MALADDTYDPALAIGCGGSSALVRAFARSAVVGGLAGSPGSWYRSELGGVVRVRSPAGGYVGPWVVTLGPLVVEDNDKAPAYPFNGLTLARAAVQYGVGGAAFTAEVDWPYAGACFAVSGSFVEVSLHRLSTTGQPAAIATPDQTIPAIAAVVPGTRGGRNFSAPTWTSPNFTVSAGAGALGPVVPVPPFAVSCAVGTVQATTGSLVYLEQYWDDAGAASGVGAIRSTPAQPGSPSAEETLLGGSIVHPSARYVRVRYDAGGPMLVFVVFLLDLGAG